MAQHELFHRKQDLGRRSHDSGNDQLARSVDGENWTEVASQVFTAVNGKATYTWEGLDYVDNAGRVYQYRIVEADPGEGHDVSHEEPGYRYTAPYYNWTFSLTNTYK